MPHCWMVNALNEFLTFSFSKVLNLFGVHVKGESLLLVVELWSINLLEASAWTEEVLGKVHVCSSTGSMVLHHTAWCESIENHIGRERNGEKYTKHDSSLRHLIKSNLESDVGGTV